MPHQFLWKQSNRGPLENALFPSLCLSLLPHDLQAATPAALAYKHRFSNEAAKCLCREAGANCPTRTHDQGHRCLFAVSDLSELQKIPGGTAIHTGRSLVPFRVQAWQSISYFPS